MKLETITTPTKEVFVELHKGAVCVTQWSNGEGVAFQVTGEHGALHASGLLQWDHADALIAAISALRAS